MKKLLRAILIPGLSWLLIVGGAGLAQTPSAVPPVPDAPRLATYMPTSSTQLFNVPFAVYGDCTDLIVTVNGVGMTLGTDFSCASASGRALASIARPITDLQITLALPVTSGVVNIQSLYRPRNVSVPTAPGITRTEFERTINSIIAGQRDLYQIYGRTNPQGNVFGAWSQTTAYPPNAVVGYGGQIWQAVIGNIDQVPTASSPYWSAIPTSPYNLTFNNFQLPGQQVGVAAAPSIDLGLLVNHNAQITGSGVSIASFGSSCSTGLPLYYITFAGADTLVNNATSMILPNAGNNIQTAAGDTAVAQCLGSGNWQVISYTPLGGAGITNEVRAFNLSSCPAGWNAADGTNGTVDLRGVVVRGLDNGKGYDTGRTLATYQADQLQDHTHNYSNSTAQSSASSPGGITVTHTPFVATATGGVNATDASGNAVRVGSETRMKNVALLYCQKL